MTDRDDDDDLPLDPVKRRAAVDAQFDDFKAQVAALTPDPAPDHAAAWHRKALDACQDDLVAVLKKHWSRLGTQGVVDVLTETTGSVLADIKAVEPAAGPHVDRRLDEVVLYVATTGSTPQ